MRITVRTPDKEYPPEPLVASVRTLLAATPTPAPAATPASAPAPPTPVAPATPEPLPQDTARQDAQGINFEPRLKRHDLNNNPARTGSAPTDLAAPTLPPNMPSQAELMQRQPLLRKPEAPHPTTDESDPDRDTSPQRGDFIVEIPAGVPREERYPKEIWKTIVSFLFLFICVCINMISLSLVHERLPDRATTPPLPDIFLDNVAARDWGLSVSEYLIMLSTTVAMLVVVFHSHRFIVARRLFFIIGLLYLYRSLTMFVTVLPVSSTTYFCSPKSNSTSPLFVLRRAFYIISGFGLSINGKHTFCGDYIYSGHTMVLVLSYLIVCEYSPKRLWPVHWALWVTAALGVFFVLFAHGHYTVDVIIAYYITTRLWWSVHACIGARGGTWTRREWWARPLAWLERNVRGPVPRRYSCPIPLPLSRAKLWGRLS